MNGARFQENALRVLDFHFDIFIALEPVEVLEITGEPGGTGQRAEAERALALRVAVAGDHRMPAESEMGVVSVNIKRVEQQDAALQLEHKHGARDTRVGFVDLHIEVDGGAGWDLESGGEEDAGCMGGHFVE